MLRTRIGTQAWQNPLPVQGPIFGGAQPVGRFKCGLVVGKFSPLHRGHGLLVRRALDSCDEVVILSYSNPEVPGCETRRRDLWLRASFPTARILTMDEQSLDPGEEFTKLPHNDAPASIHHNFCAFVCETRIETPVEAIFTSEDHGAEFAAHLTERFRKRNADAPAVTHVAIDRDPSISSTRIRANVHAHRDWLIPGVYESFVKRVCTLGGKASGKTTLAQALATKFETTCVPEYGRELWKQKNGELVYEDLLAIARRQVEREQSAATGANRYLFCDTSPLTTLFYSLELFGRAEPELETLSRRKYDLHVLCAPDFKFDREGTRRDAAFRQRQHEWYLQNLARRGIPYLLAAGTIEARLDRITWQLSDLKP
jgi:NadR type nicotinamide-nucleotide adenylyltransferase